MYALVPAFDVVQDHEAHLTAYSAGIAGASSGPCGSLTVMSVYTHHLNSPTSCMMHFLLKKKTRVCLVVVMLQLLRVIIESYFGCIISPPTMNSGITVSDMVFMLGGVSLH